MLTSRVVTTRLTIGGGRRPVQPLHGVNLGPIDAWWSRDFHDQYTAAAIPSVRLHDASLMVGDVVDLHCVFPNPGADPLDPASFNFALTDAYLQRIRDCGAEIYFRLGESIDHSPHKIYLDLQRWTPALMATVCDRVVAHYTGGWANGHEWEIPYWEFWNEPESGWSLPASQRCCWSGSSEDYLHYYSAVARAVKSQQSASKVGVAGFINTRFTLEPADDNHIPGWSELIPKILAAGAPLDFVSWHKYTSRWDAIAVDAHQVRGYLDGLGLTDAESHLTEWNHQPIHNDEGVEFRYLDVYTDPSRADRIETAHARILGPEGAAFTFGALALLQDLPVDRAHMYTGLAGGFGMFTANGGWTPKYEALRSFGSLFAGKPRRAIEPPPPGVQILVVEDGTSTVRIAVATSDEPQQLAFSFADAKDSGLTLQHHDVLEETGWASVPPPCGENGLSVIAFPAHRLSLIEYTT